MSDCPTDEPLKPLTIRMHDSDNVAIVANDGGLPAGTALPSGLVLRDKVPQGHKVALVDLPAGGAVLRYGIPIGYAISDIPAGSWVHERLLSMPEARELDALPMATTRGQALPPLEGYTFEGYRNADGSVGTRNILAITQTVQCVAGAMWRCSVSKMSCCRATRMWTMWWRWSTPTAAAWRLTRPTPSSPSAPCAT